MANSRVLEGPNALTRALTGLEQIRDRDQARARLIVELLGSLKTEAFFPGQADLFVLPPVELAAAARKASLPVVVSNLDPRFLPAGWLDHLVWEVDGHRVLLLGLLGSPRTEQQRTLSPVLPVVSTVRALRERVGPVDAVVAFTSATELERRTWDKEGDLPVDVLLAPFEKEEQLPERWRGDRYELTADPLGRSLRRLDIVFSGRETGVARQPDAEPGPRAAVSQEHTWLRLRQIRAELAAQVDDGQDPRVMVRGYDGKLRPDPDTDPALVQQGMADLVVERDRSRARVKTKSTMRHLVMGSLIVLPPELPEDSAMTERIDLFQAQWLEELERRVAVGREEGGDDGRRYGGMDTCVGCHPAEYASWGRSDHRGAYATLREHAEHRNPDCLACHSTGFGKEGGFADPQADTRLLNVQCEACHGAMASHAREAGTGSAVLAPSRGLTVTEATCTRCHDPVNSPEFDYEEYLSRGAHPRRAAGGGNP
ncbi:MAG: cytochrome c family protein [Deltaproteobacteria bacterium]|nr:cytochrome c family protein [Deltaproteobacteria bacterium]